MLVLLRNREEVSGGQKLLTRNEVLKNCTMHKMLLEGSTEGIKDGWDL
jgi:hypothetical protein